MCGEQLGMGKNESVPPQSLHIINTALQRNKASSLLKADPCTRSPCAASHKMSAPFEVQEGMSPVLKLVCGQCCPPSEVRRFPHSRAQLLSAPAQGFPQPCPCQGTRSCSFP